MNVSLRHYLAKLKITKQPTVIVEGDTDIYAIKKLVQNRFADSAKLRIEDASEVRDDAMEGLSKREFLEMLAQKVAESRSSQNLFHILVDREFRALSPQGDEIAHSEPEVVANRVFWTWGHSIENYLLSVEVIAQYFQSELSSDCAELAVDLLVKSHGGMLAAAYGLTLSIFDEHRPTSYIGSLGFRCFTLSDGEFEFDVSKWEQELRKQKHQPEAISRITNRYAHILQSEVEDPVVAQWYAHGHLAFNLQAGLIECILAKLSADFWDAKQLQGQKQSQLQLALTRSWASCTNKDGVRYPRALMESISNFAVAR